MCIRDSLAALYDGGVGSGPKAGDPRLLQPVHRPQDQGVVRGHHAEVDGMLLGKLDLSVQILGADGNADGVFRNAAISRQGVKLRNLRVFF